MRKKPVWLTIVNIQLTIVNWILTIVNKNSVAGLITLNNASTEEVHAILFAETRFKKQKTKTVLCPGRRKYFSLPLYSAWIMMPNKTKFGQTLK